MIKSLITAKPVVSVFSVELPLTSAPAPPRAHDRPGTFTERARTGASEWEMFGAPCALEGVRLLLVEGEQDPRELLKTILEGCGAALTEAGSAAEALAALSA